MFLSLGPELVISILGDVSNPGQCLVSRLLDDLQISNLEQIFKKNVDIAKTISAPESQML